MEQGKSPENLIFSPAKRRSLASAIEWKIGPWKISRHFHAAILKIRLIAYVVISNLSNDMTVNSQIIPSENLMQSLRRHISNLATLPTTEEPTISAFLDLRQPIESVRSSFWMWATSARMTLPRRQRPAFDEAKAHIDEMLRRDWPEDVHSVAVFTRAGEFPLDVAISFQATLDLHFDVGDRPSIFPLVQLKDRFHRFVVVICSEETGRIIEVTLGAVSEEILTTKPEMANHIGRGMSREHFHHRRQENNRRFHKDQVEIITRLMARRGINHLILAGHPRHIAAVRDLLPKNIEARIVGSVFRSPNGHDYSPVLEQAIHAFVEAEQSESRTTVERLHEQIRRKGLGVVGIHPSRQALELGAASQLVISEELPHADREELVRLAVSHDIPIEVCEQDELLQEHGGVGCLLRYRLEYQLGDNDVA